MDSNMTQDTGASTTEQPQISQDTKRVGEIVDHCITILEEYAEDNGLDVTSILRMASTCFRQTCKEAKLKRRRRPNPWNAYQIMKNAKKEVPVPVFEGAQGLAQNSKALAAKYNALKLDDQDTTIIELMKDDNYLVDGVKKANRSTTVANRDIQNTIDQLGIQGHHALYFFMSGDPMAGAPFVWGTLYGKGFFYDRMEATGVGLCLFRDYVRGIREQTQMQAYHDRQVNDISRPAETVAQQVRPPQNENSTSDQNDLEGEAEGNIQPPLQQSGVNTSTGRNRNKATKSRSRDDVERDMREAFREVVNTATGRMLRRLPSNKDILKTLEQRNLQLILPEWLSSARFWDILGRKNERTIVELQRIRDAILSNELNITIR